MRNQGYQTPLIADIHFTPNAAELAARLVEKVRVNPGNYADKKKFDLIEYSDSDYQEELDRIRERFTPLVKICKEYGTAMRIGTNHGSLSDRILSRYGDTPLGMVESAMEFLRICEDHHYHNIVLSMKASNPKVMVEAYRLLVATMMQHNMNYPLHLGVTEAGDGEDGRIKSAAGIGTLLEDGLGDTVRVSLTEDPEFEAPVAIALVNRYQTRSNAAKVKPPSAEAIALYTPFEFSKRESNAVMHIGKDNVPRVIADFSERDEITEATFFALGYHYSQALDKWNLSDMACDFVYLGNKDIAFEIPGTLGLIYNHQTWQGLPEKKHRYPLFCGDEYFRTMYKSDELNFVAADYPVLTEDFLKKISEDASVVLILDSFHEHAVAEQRAAFMQIVQSGCKVPVVIKRNYHSLSDELLQLYAATDFASLLMDGYGNGTWIKTIDCGNPVFNNRLAFGVLQASRTRISKTEYISCPSCGRTLFDLQETTARIRKRTQHLKGVKIGIMGCIVNGPGEMADADYGYVGTGVGKITLYKGREVVERNVNSENAVDALIDLIKKHGDWVEKE